MRVVPVPCLKDNYAYLVVCERTGQAAVVDASEAEPVLAAVKREGVKLVAIWSTHHHLDHVGGNDEVVRAGGIREVSGHVSDKGRTPEQTRFLETGDVVGVGSVKARAMHIPGHTLGRGRVLRRGKGRRPSSPATRFSSPGAAGSSRGRPRRCTALSRRSPRSPARPASSAVTSTPAANLRFALHVEPSNAAIDRRRARRPRARGREAERPRDDRARARDEPLPAREVARDPAHARDRERRRRRERVRGDPEGEGRVSRVTTPPDRAARGAGRAGDRRSRAQPPLAARIGGRPPRIFCAPVMSMTPRRGAPS